MSEVEATLQRINGHKVRALSRSHRASNPARRTPRVEPRARLAPPSALGSIHAPARLTARE
jgi:hypothetical protein